MPLLQSYHHSKLILEEYYTTIHKAFCTTTEFIGLFHIFFSFIHFSESYYYSASGGGVVNRLSSVHHRRRVATPWPPTFYPSISAPSSLQTSTVRSSTSISSSTASNSVAKSVAALPCPPSSSQSFATDSYLNQAFSFPSHDSKGPLSGGQTVASSGPQTSAVSNTNPPWLRPNRSVLKSNLSPHHHQSTYFCPPAAPFSGGNYFASSGGASESVLESGGNKYGHRGSSGDLSSGVTSEDHHLSRMSKSSSAMHAMPHLSSGAGSGHGHQYQSSSNNNSKPVKVKRTRQRVDAGEPRNSYASIANFSSRGGYHGYHPSHKFGSSHSSSSNSSSSHHSSGSLANGLIGMHQHQQHQHSLAMASQGNTVNLAPHPSPSNQAEQVFASKQMREASALNQAAAMAAAAASSRPDMILDPAIMQIYQNQMAALMNAGAYSHNSKTQGSTVQDQLALNNALCNANAFFNQLQSDASMANLMNNFNMESAAAAALLTSTSVEAQMLRDILESGSRALEKNSNSTASQQQQASLGDTSKQSVSPKPKSRSSSKLFADLELDAEMDFADPFAQLKSESEMDRFSLATPGEDGTHDEEKSGDEERQDSGSLEEKEKQSQLQSSKRDKRVKGKEGEGNMDAEGDQVEEDVNDEAKERKGLSGSECGSGKEATEMGSEEALAKTAAARDGNSRKEERRGRGRPSLQSSQWRDKSPTYSSLASGSTSSAAGTSLGLETSSSASFSAKIASSADQHHTWNGATTQLAHNEHSTSAQLPTTDFASADDQDRLTADDSLALSTHSQQSQHSKPSARVEDIFSNMLLVTNSNGVSTGATTPSSPTNHALSPLKSYDGESDSSIAKPQTQGVNGCKKRKLYQPQQSSKLQNGSLDTEDDDDIEEEIVTAPEVELGVEAELNESFNDLEENHRRHVSPAQADLPKEMEHSTPVPARNHSTRSEHLPTKRARLSDYEREYKLHHSLQSQLYSIQAKYAVQQLYAQQQQAQSKATNGSQSQFARASPVNIALPPADCDSMLDDKERSSKNRSGSTAVSKISDMDGLIESVKGQIINSIEHIFDTAFRNYKDPSARPEFQSQQRDNRGNELLAQMLDSKYQRSQSVRSAPANAISLNNGTKNLGRDGSPFALPSEASTAPKTFGYAQSSLGGGLYGKQPFYTAQNMAAAYSGNVNNNGLLLNGLRENASVLNNNNNNSPFGRDNASPVLPEQSEALSLVVAPKKRRNKVTDSRLTPRTGNRIDGRSSASPPMSSMHFNTSSLGGVSLGGLQHDFFDTGATSFPFADQSRLSSLFANGDEADLMKSSLSNGVSGVSAAANPVASAVAQAAAAHHLQMLAASRASPDSLSGYPASLLTSFGRGSGTGSENGGDGSETNDTQSIYDPSMPMTSTLSPMHLRKAKLMFFYVRYPSSSVLKMFFPDIKFNKNNTAQLVKWFSNFREFYYIQMEKYARQALSEGIKCAEDLNVTDDCELIRVLNLHYNRSNHIPIPENFRGVCETTLREFFRSLQQNKDNEQSWKKSIYKVIARLDDNVPEYFKNPNFMEQLE